MSTKITTSVTGSTTECLVTLHAAVLGGDEASRCVSAVALNQDRDSGVVISASDDTVKLAGMSWRKYKVRDVGNLSQCLCESSMSPIGDEVACQEWVSNG